MYRIVSKGKSLGFVEHVLVLGVDNTVTFKQHIMIFDTIRLRSQLIMKVACLNLFVFKFRLKS